MRQCLCRERKVVYSDKFNCGIVKPCPEYIPPDPAKTIDTNSYPHFKKPPFALSGCLSLKRILSCSAFRARPVRRQFIKPGAGRNALFCISLVRVIAIAAYK